MGATNEVVADVAADGLMVEFAQREPEEGSEIGCLAPFRTSL